MTEERRLLATGMPLDEIINTCHALRRDSALPEFVADKERHACRCGGAGNCPDCPNKKK